jgi:DNA primase
MTTGNLRHTLAELETMATIRPIRVSGGQKLRMGCPFHGSDKQRSLEVDLGTGRFACYTCGAWGYLSDHPGRDRRGAGRGLDRKSRRPDARDGFRTHQEARTAWQKSTVVLQDPPVPPLSRPGQDQKLARYMDAAQRHLEDPAALAYLQARHTPVDLARAHGLGYFPPTMWPGRRAAARWGRLAFPLETPAGELVGVYSRALDPQYPQEKAPAEVRHDVWARRGLFNAAALAGPSLYLTEACFDALSMLAGGYPTSAALVGTKGLPWAALGKVRELYLCLDRDATGEGQRAALELARIAVLRGLRGYTMGAGAYGGYPEPSEQWEREGRVTLRACGDCNIPVHPPTADRCPTCGAPMCPGCMRCDPSCPIMGGDLSPLPEMPTG